jgi:4-hydroxyphenylacetate 3-monooxygenase
MGIRTGRQYLDSLRDGREVYIDGERIRDVAADARLRGGALTTAEIYDLQHRADLIEEMTLPSASSGDRVALSFIEPRTIEDLTRRGRAMKRTMDYVYGMFGRAPDFLNVTLTAFASASAVFDEGKHGKGFGRNIRAYYEHVRDNDLALTHVLVNPQVDRSRPIHLQKKVIAARVVKETDSGFYVKGARLVGTLSQFANEILVMPSAIVPNDPAAEDYSLGFAVPVSTPGLKVLSRPSLAPTDPGHFLDHPLSLRLDEGDAVVVFDNVFVPWERTFIYRDPQLNNSIYQRSHATAHASHQTAIRTLAKAEFMCGLACHLADSINVDEFLNVAGMLSDLLIHVETQRALIYSAEQHATPTPFGTVAPNRFTLGAAQLNFFRKFDEMVDAVRTVGAGGIVAAPSYAELGGPAAAEVREYFQSAKQTSEERIRLLRLAADTCMSSFAARQQLYERYYQGDPVRTKARFYAAYPKDELLGRVTAAMEDMVRRGEQFESDRSRVAAADEPVESEAHESGRYSVDDDRPRQRKSSTHEQRDETHDRKDQRELSDLHSEIET